MNAFLVFGGAVGYLANGNQGAALGLAVTSVIYGLLVMVGMNRDN